jgi:hypothetical protein
MQNKSQHLRFTETSAAPAKNLRFRLRKKEHWLLRLSQDTPVQVVLLNGS